jgi:hypothetical protein
MTAGQRRAAAVWALPALFAVTLFVSAALLFVVELMMARLVLPPLGGTPAVWNTCMVFFQALLLAGYAYAHVASKWLGDRRQAAVHLAVLLLPLLVLPVALPAGWTPPGESWPVPWLLAVLVVAVGLPFFAVSTSAPLLQRWFAATGHPSARDPYFLYAASNLGSMVGLLAYPTIIEPLSKGLAQQGVGWTAGYVLFVVLAAACAWTLWRSGKVKESVRIEPAPAIAWNRRLRWVLLAFVPSSLMLSTTTYLTTDIAAVPLLWVVPLAVYLLTFVLAFARRQFVTPEVLGRWLPLAALLVVLALLSEATEPVWVLMLLHLICLFWVGLFCHASLAADRPPAGRLVEFYLWLAFGGVLGGIFNALLAPLLFNSLAEYPLVLVLACALRPLPPEWQEEQTAARRWLDWALPVVLGLVSVGAVRLAQRMGLAPGPLSLGLIFGLPAVVCYTFLDRPLRFSLGLAALLLAGTLYQGVYGATLYRTRSFFGVHRVTLDPTHSYRLLVHGNTIHGQQSLDPARRREALTYYHRRGPIGKVFTTMDKVKPFKSVGVVGLGTGALCCYAQQGQRWTYYEIDPAVEEIACHSGYFTFWQDCIDLTGVVPKVVPGDARLTLARAEEKFDLLVIDAFSSDAIPVHLLTHEALEIYRAHLNKGGILAFNVSNRYLDLESVLGDLAAAASPRMACKGMENLSLSDSDKRGGQSPSHWVVLAERAETLDPLPNEAPWGDIKGRPGRRIWSDDYTNLIGALKWRSFDER